MKSSIKLVIFIGLLAVLFVIAACAPKEGAEEAAIAGQAYGGCSPVLQNVKSCTDAGTSVSGEKQNGRSFSYTDSCVSGNKKLREHTCQTVSSSCPANMPAGQTCPPPSTMVVRCTTSCPSNQCDSNTKQCVAPLPVCGNNIKEGTEVCDGTDLGDSAMSTCNAKMKNPAATGTVQCAADCTNFDLSGCEAGEETVLEVPTEVCQIDGTELCEVCDGNIDNNNNGQIDEGCDDDNDNRCDAAMYISPSYFTGCYANADASPWCCTPTQPLDCDDNDVWTGPHKIEMCDTKDNDCDGSIDEYCPEACDSYDNDNDGQIDEGCYEWCFDGIDNNGNGVINENCQPYYCSDSDPENNPLVMGKVTITSGNEQVLNYEGMQPAAGQLSDYCDLPFIMEKKCPVPMADHFDTLTGGQTVKTVSCPAETTCQDPDGPQGSTPAICR